MVSPFGCRRRCAAPGGVGGSPAGACRRHAVSRLPDRRLDRGELRRIRARRGSHRVLAADRRHAGVAGAPAAQSAIGERGLGEDRDVRGIGARHSLRADARPRGLRAAERRRVACAVRHRRDAGSGPQSGDGGRSAPERHAMGGGALRLSCAERRGAGGSVRQRGGRDAVRRGAAQFRSEPRGQHGRASRGAAHADADRPRARGRGDAGRCAGRRRERARLAAAGDSEGAG